MRWVWRTKRMEMRMKTYSANDVPIILSKPVEGVEGLVDASTVLGVSDLLDGCCCDCLKGFAGASRQMQDGCDDDVTKYLW
jgi:hypothetical protein